ncbi:MAG: hypothetical protein EKK57_12285 [Proteobacteria bacterium]|nr:MAG: hypothetical protein EKK57_12285 [Pseudomonadota bacterium]
MRTINIPASTHFIPIDKFDICLIDNKLKVEIIKTYPTRADGAYYLDKFSNYLRDNHSISLRDYCIEYLKFEWPKCPVKKELTGYKICGAGLRISQFNRGGITKETCPNFNKSCELASKNRMGSGNPMHGKKPWNKGIGLENPIIASVAAKNRGIKRSQETIEKLSNSAKARKIHGHTGCKHSIETRNKLRENTARLWAEGVFNKTTSIHLKVREYLNSLNLIHEFTEEHQLVYFSLDFAFPSVKVAIECQGTYYHVDPRKYPNGPTNAMQKRNFGRDIAKRKFCCDQLGWTIIELWETEINNGEFRQNLLCKLQELNLLKK